MKVPSLQQQVFLTTLSKRITLGYCINGRLGIPGSHLSTSMHRHHANTLYHSMTFHCIHITHKILQKISTCIKVCQNFNFTFEPLFTHSRQICHTFSHTLHPPFFTRKHFNTMLLLSISTSVHTSVCICHNLRSSKTMSIPRPMNWWNINNTSCSFCLIMVDEMYSLVHSECWTLLKTAQHLPNQNTCNCTFSIFLRKITYFHKSTAKVLTLYFLFNL